MFICQSVTGTNNASDINPPLWRVFFKTITKFKVQIHAKMYSKYNSNTNTTKVFKICCTILNTYLKYYLKYMYFKICHPITVYWAEQLCFFWNFSSDHNDKKEYLEAKVTAWLCQSTTPNAVGDRIFIVNWARPPDLAQRRCQYNTSNQLLILFNCWVGWKLFKTNFLPIHFTKSG